MAERRTVAKKISVSEQVNSLSSDFVRLLFSWMILHADDYGVLSGSAWSIRSLVIPMLDHTNAEVESALRELDESGLIWRYSGPDQKPYIQFRTWEVHQSGLHKRTQPHLPLFYDPRNGDADAAAVPEVPGDSSATLPVTSSFPEVPGSSRKFPEVPASRARRTEEKGNEEKGNEEKGNEEKGTEPLRLAQPTAQASGETSEQPPSGADAHRQDASFASDALLSQDEESPREAPTPIPKPRAAPPNPLWDALVEIFGYAPRTQPECNKWGSIVKHLKAAKATPEDVRRAKTHYDAGVALGVYTWNLTPNALDSHLGELLQPPQANTKGKNGGNGNGTHAENGRYARQNSMGGGATPARFTPEYYARAAGANGAKRNSG